MNLLGFGDQSKNNQEQAQTKETHDCLPGVHRTPPTWRSRYTHRGWLSQQSTRVTQTRALIGYNGALSLSLCSVTTDSSRSQR